MRLVILFSLALSIHLLHAQETKEVKNEISFIDKIRPHFKKIFGKEWSEKIFGNGQNDNSSALGDKPEVAMPVIPVVTEDAKSIAVYDKKVESISLKPEDEQKFNYAFIKELYQATRQENVNEDEMGKFMNVLSQGGTREGIYRSVVLDSTYGGMENWDRPVKSHTADYAVSLYGKYFGKKVQKKSFEGMSIYTLKRLVTERALDTVDAFGENREDLEKWYGIMSAELALKFPQIWTNKMRSNTSALVHKKWAEKVPIQHIKSEVIIKIHSAFNSLI